MGKRQRARSRRGNPAPAAAAVRPDAAGERRGMSEDEIILRREELAERRAAREQRATDRATSGAGQRRRFWSGQAQLGVQRIVLPRAAGSASDSAAGAILAVIAWALGVNYLQGGTDQVRAWWRAKFLNQPMGKAPASTAAQQQGLEQLLVAPLQQAVAPAGGAAATLPGQESSGTGSNGQPLPTPGGSLGFLWPGVTTPAVNTSTGSSSSSTHPAIPVAG